MSKLYQIYCVFSHNGVYNVPQSVEHNMHTSLMLTFGLVIKIQHNCLGRGAMWFNIVVIFKLCT